VGCEHAFVTSQGHAYSRFRRALLTKNLRLIDAAAAELLHVPLDDALRILIVMAEKRDPRLERAAVRWIGRLLTETPTTFRDARFALAMVERLPECSGSLQRLASRR
jgi:hypothetical protein